MALIGNHQINYRAAANSNLKNLRFDATIQFEETQYIYIKKFGTDTWKLNVGQILSTMAEELNSKTPVSSTIITLQNPEVLSFTKGLMQWASHSINIKVDYSVTKAGNMIKSGTVNETGSGSGTEFGFLTFIPILGNVNFDKGIEIAVYRCLEKCLFKINEEIKPVL
jgi:hypothetical protein